MSRIARISDNQHVTLEDFLNLAKDPRNAMDDVILAAIERNAKYYGGTVTRTATTRVTVSTPVILFRLGEVYSRDDAPIEIDFLANLPTSGNQRYCAIVAQGETINDEAEARDFVVDATSNPPTVEAASTSIREYRRCNISVVVGTAAPTPVKPAIDAALTPIAYVLLTSTQVDPVVEQVTTSRITSLGEAVSRLLDVEAFRLRAEDLLNGLRSDIAKLQNASKGNTDLNLTGYMLEQIARLNEATGIGEDAALSATDFFLTDDDSDVQNVNYLARVEEGLRFDYANFDEMPLALLNPGDTRFIVHSNGLLLPKYNNQTLVSIVGRDNEAALSNAGSQNIAYTQRTESKTRIRWGNSKKVCTNSSWWKSGRYDQALGTFRRADETWEVSLEDRNSKHRRLTQFWTDTYDEIYWDRLTTTASYVGNVCGQTFLMPRSAWVTKLRLGFSRVDTGGDVRVLICKATNAGAPDMDSVLGTATIAQASLKVFPALTEVPLTPVLLEVGQRYALVLITAGNHWLALATNNKYAQGTFFTSTDSAWFQGDIANDACFELIGAEFEAPRVSIDLDNWNLDGGLTDIDILATQVAIEPATITYEVRIGGVWTPVQDVGPGNHPLFGLPASVQARMILNGTTEMMPGIFMIRSHVTLSRPRTTALHVSTVRDPAVNVPHVEIIAVLEHYVEANHNCVASLLTGGTFATEIAASSTSDQVLTDGSIKRRWIFSGLTPLNNYKRKISLATTSALSVFHVAELTDVAYPS